MDNANTTPLSSAFGTDDGPQREKRQIEIFPARKDDKLVDDDYDTRYVDADYEYARTNIYQTIEQGQELLNDAMTFVKSAPSGRAFEVAFNAVGMLIDSQQKLLDLAKKNKELKTVERSEENTTVNNNLIMTTEQLQKLLVSQGIKTTTREQK